MEIYDRATQYVEMGYYSPEHLNGLAEPIAVHNRMASLPFTAVLLRDEASNLSSQIVEQPVSKITCCRCCFCAHLHPMHFCCCNCGVSPGFFLLWLSSSWLAELIKREAPTTTPRHPFLGPVLFRLCSVMSQAVAKWRSGQTRSRFW